MNNAIDNALEAIRHANPVPDPADLADAMLRSSVFLTATKEKSMSLDKDRPTNQTSESKQSGRRRNLLAVVAALAVVVVAGAVIATVNTGEDTTAAGAATGPVTIVVNVDFSGRPVVGTFEVTEGADILGCSTGTFEDTFDEATRDVSKLMTCSGPDTGTFTILFDPDGYDTGAGEHAGPWSILDGSADFAGLQGEGDYLHPHDPPIERPDGPDSSVDIYTGVIEHTS